MTYFLSLRQSMKAGAVAAPKLVIGSAGSPGLKEVLDVELPRIFRGRDVLFATHGFNVNGVEGINALGHLESSLAPFGSELFVGVLWPGDWWIPAINYVWEAGDAVDCGKRLAAYCRKNLSEARSLSFLSHSLGGRVMLEAVKRLDGKARVLCLTAAAVDNDCLQRQYATVPGKCKALANLASRRDNVLKYAYPVGDLIADVLGDDDSPFVGALGREGPKGARPANVAATQIPDGKDYDHGDYLPPSTNRTPPVPDRWTDATDFMARAYRELPQVWP